MIIKTYINEDFLLHTETAKRLYHEYAEKMPIIDYHCHIQPREIAFDKRFENVSQVMLGGDHYKWRMIRSNGVPEQLITGESSDWDKFYQFAKILPKAIGNPIYHWTHLELKRYFEYDGVLNEETASEVWDLCNAKLRQKDMSVHEIIKKSNVKVIGTTDDPIDTLEWHKAIAEESSFKCKVVPSFRPDKAVNIHKSEVFLPYILSLGKSAGVTIQCFDDLKEALCRRMDVFAGMGCRASDSGLDYVMFRPSNPHETDQVFKKSLQGEPLSVLASYYLG